MNIERRSIIAMCQDVLDYKLYEPNGQMKWWCSSNIPINDMVIAYDDKPIGACMCVSNNPKIGVYVLSEYRGKKLGYKMLCSVLDNIKDSVRVVPQFIRNHHSIDLFNKIARKYSNVEIVNKDEFYWEEREKYKNKTCV